MALDLLQPSTTVVARELRAAAERVGAALRAADPAAPTAIDWDARTLAAHLATGIEGYVHMLRGEPSHLDDFARRNEAGAAALAAEAATPMADLVERLEKGVAAFAAELEQLQAGDQVGFYATPLPAGTVGGIFLSELLVHGWDLAKLPIPPEAAALAAPCGFAILPMLVKPGKPERATLAFKLRGHGGLRVALDGMDVSVLPPDGPADVRLSAEPVTFLLTTYGRQSPTKGLLTGKLAVLGRRPWRLGAIQSRFDTA